MTTNELIKELTAMKEAGNGDKVVSIMIGDQGPLYINFVKTEGDEVQLNCDW
ncbi:MAG: hypothetical protein LKE54_07525 [Prevotella sp.]|jgi:hypothetical protein|nr:hypothetical protein [Prevotella sp.]MCH3994883.1 hypothetical protein [Prevotella sp.]